MTNESQQRAADGGRTENKRYEAGAEFGADELIVGDRIDPTLVASTMGGLGNRRSADPDDSVTQLAEATITSRMDDIHQAILVDGESGVLVRATRHDSQSAWTQREADWKVREIGNRVTVSDAEVQQDGSGEWEDIDVVSEAEAWANVVLQDRAKGHDDYNDELTLTGRSSLQLYEPYGTTRVYTTINFE